MTYAKAKGDSWKRQNSVSPQTARKIGLSRSRSADLSSAGLSRAEARLLGELVADHSDAPASEPRHGAPFATRPRPNVTALLELVSGTLALSQVTKAYAQAITAACRGEAVSFSPETLHFSDCVLALMRRYRAKR